MGAALVFGFDIGGNAGEAILCLGTIAPQNQTRALRRVRV
jgi:hypothetical protein